MITDALSSASAFLGNYFTSNILFYIKSNLHTVSTILQTFQISGPQSRLIPQNELVHLDQIPGNYSH